MDITQLRKKNLLNLNTLTPVERDDKELFFNRIPQALKDLEQHVNWRAVEDQDTGKIKKPPIHPITGYPMSATNPANWLTFDEAIAAYRDEQNHLAGIGLALSKDDPFTALDFDNCIDENGVISSVVQGILDHFEGHKEISPSKTGVRLIVRGKLPGPAIKQDGIEMYDRDRYVTLTGNLLPGSSPELPDQQTALDALYQGFSQNYDEAPATNGYTGGGVCPTDSLTDDQLKAKIANSKNGARFTRLDNGDLSDYGGDQSLADLAYCGMLAFWTGKNPDRMDRMFRDSELYRDKWDQGARSGETYGQGTIRIAIERTKETYSGPTAVNGSNHASPGPQAQPGGPGASTEQSTRPRKKIYDLDDIDDLPLKDWLITGIVGPGDQAMIYGPSGGGKTWTGIDIAMAAAAGAKVANRFDVVRPLKVWYLAGEGQGGLPARLKGARAKYNPPKGNFSYTPEVPQLFELTSDDAAQYFIEDWQASQEGNPDLLVIDTYADATDGLDENSAEHTKKVIRTVEKIIKVFGCAVLLIHHTNKGGLVERGSGALKAKMQCMILVDERGPYHTVECTKSRDAEKWKGLSFTLEANPDDIRYLSVKWAEGAENTGGSRDYILDLLQDDPDHWWGAKEIADTLGNVGSDENVRQQLSKLVEAGKVTKQKTKYKAAENTK